MDVGAPAHRPGVAESLGCRVDRRDDVGLTDVVAGVDQRTERRDARTPGPEVLHRGAGAHDRRQVPVAVRGVDADHLAGRVEVGEQLATAELVAGTNCPGQPPITDPSGVLTPALPVEAELDGRAGDLDVVGLERRQPEAAVLAAVLVVADTDERAVEQRDHERLDLAPRQARPGEIVAQRRAELRQRRAEVGEAVELRAVTDLAPPRVVPVLLAAAGVPARRLQVPSRIRADPHIGPGRRNGEAVDPLPVRSAHGAAGRSGVGEPTTTSLAPDAGLGVHDVAQPGVGRRLEHLGIVDHVAAHRVRAVPRDEHTGSLPRSSAGDAPTAGFARPQRSSVREVVFAMPPCPRGS